MSGASDPISAFADAFLLALRPGQRVWLGRIVARGGQVSEAERRACPALAPLLIQDGAEGLVLPAPIRGRLAARLAHITRMAGVAAQISEANARGDLDAALELLRAHGGAFISMTEGLEAAQKIADSFPEAALTAHATLSLLHMVNALKAGDLARADMLFDAARRRFDLPGLSDPHPDPETICALFMKAVYDDSPVPDAALSQLFATLRDLPPDAALMRGLLYNVGLDVLMRRNRIAAADEAAQRALLHYTAAGETGLGFYIQLYLAIIALWRGDIARAGQALEAADAALAMFPGRSENDTALLQLFTRIQRYEAGDPDPLVQHLTLRADPIPFGELWPAMAAPILGYGRRALAAHATPAAALSWVQRWRLRQWRSQRFDRLISVQEARALQDLGRYQEADEVLARVPGDDTGELALVRLAAALARAPGSEELAQRLRQAQDDPGYSARQKLVLRLLLAESANARHNEREAARWLNRALSLPLSAQQARVLHEERPRLARILSSRALRGELRRLPQLNQALQGVIAQAAPALPEGLTRQEYRVLMLLAEAQPNKLIAQRLGVSLATVKFHIGNLLRKSGARGRKALVQEALARGWLPGGP